MDPPRMQEKVQDCQQILGYTFTDQHLCWEALQMAGNGVTSAGQRQIRNGNKRLAIFGEFVLGLIMGQEWYNSGTDEIIWNSVRQNVISNAKLGSLGMTKGLDRCVQLGNGQLGVSPKMMAHTVEALIGAIYLDSGEGGLAAVKGVMPNLGIQYREPVD